MFNKNLIPTPRLQKPVKKEINEEVLARFQLEPVENNQGSSRKRLKKLCQVNQSEELLDPQVEEEENIIEEEEYQQFDVKDDEELQKEKEAEEKAKQNKKMKGNQDIGKFVQQKQEQKEKKPKKEEKTKPQPQMSMAELQRIKRQKQKRRKSSDDFLASDKDQKSDEEIDERQFNAKRLAAYEIYNGNRANEQQLIEKAMQLSYTAASKKDSEDEEKQAVMLPAVVKIEEKKAAPEKKDIKQQPKSAKKVIEAPPSSKTGPLAGYVISTTGEFDNIDKDELIQLCQQLGAECPKSMVVRCNLLLQGSYVDNGFKRRSNQLVDDTDKSKKARERGIKIIPFSKLDDFFLQTTGKNLEMHLKKNTTVINPIASFMYKPIEKEIERKPVQEYIEKKPIHTESIKPPIKPVQVQSIRAQNLPSQPVRKEQKMEIEEPKKIPTSSFSGMLWSDKYKPTKLEEVIGESSQIKSLREWLECWEDIHIHGNKRDVKETKGWNAAGSINSFAALLSGDPGIGKTTTARLIAKQFGYAITQFNASDVRNKSGIDLMETGSFNLGRKTMEKSLIIMDEVDGMSSGDRGGITAIISMIKNTKVPIICICNDRSSDKIRSLAGHCLDVKFHQPNKALVVRRLMEILRKEGGSGEQRALEQLVDTFQNDMRQILCYLEVIFKTVSPTITMKTLHNRNQSSKDATVMINHVDAVKRLLNRPEFSKMRIADRTDCCFVNSDMVPLMVQENLLTSARKSSLNFNQFHNLVQGVKGMVIGDLLDRTIRKEQEWGLMPSYAFMTCVYGPEKISESAGFPSFPSWLGKFSSERKMKRLSKEFKDAISPMTNVSSWKAAKENYVPIIVRELSELLKQDKVEDAVQLMEHYNITPAMIGDHLTSLHFTSEKNPLADVPSNVKGKLTRLYNKRHEDSKLKQTAKPKSKVELVKFDPLLEEAEEVDEDEPEEEKEEEVAKAKPKAKKK